VSTFEELRRRKIVQWSLAYLAGAWLALQVVAVLAGPFGWSGGLQRGVSVLLACGLFITLVLAWYHGERGRQRVSGPELLLLAGLLGLTGPGIRAVRSRPAEDPPGLAHSAPALAGEGAAVRRASILLPDSAALAFVGVAPLGVGRTALAISPDGARLAYVARRAGTTALFVRELDRMDVRALPGTEGAYQPFFSPDGAWIAFFTATSLKKVSVAGGRVITLAAVSEPTGGCWSPDGDILVADRQGGRLSRVPGSGGPSRPTRWQPERRLLDPQLLPGDWLLHGATDRTLSLVSLRTGRRYVLTRGGVVPRDSASLSDLLYGRNAEYLQSGHIAYVTGDGVLVVLPFDLEHLRIQDPPVPLMSRIRLEAAEGGAQLAVSRGGTFVYAPGANLRRSRFVWVDHATGTVDTLPLPADYYGAFELSPDGDRILAVRRPPSTPSELWVLDVGTGAGERVPFEGIVGNVSTWWPDGRSVVVGGSGRGNAHAGGVMVRQSLRRPDDRDTLLRGVVFVEPSPDGRSVAADLDSGWIVAPPTAIDVRAEVRRGAYAFYRFSPDGRWLAFTDNRTSARSEVYVARVDRLDEPRRVSPNGGEEAVWMPDGDALVYRSGQRWLQAAVSIGEDIEIGAPRVLFEGPYLNVAGWSHDLSPDGRRELLLLGPRKDTTTELVLVANWLVEVERAASRPIPE